MAGAQLLLGGEKCDRGAQLLLGGEKCDRGVRLLLGGERGDSRTQALPGSIQVFFGSQVLVDGAVDLFNDGFRLGVVEAGAA